MFEREKNFHEPLCEPQEKICVGIENAPQGFDLRGRIIGAGGANLLYIRGETGATVTLRGRGSQFVDPALGTESPEPLYLCIEYVSTFLYFYSFKPKRPVYVLVKSITCLI